MIVNDQSLNVDALVAPVAAGLPAGADLRYAPTYDQIKIARRTAADKQQGRSGSTGEDDKLSPEERVLAAREDWLAVHALVTGALIQSKDLQLAVWLLEAESYLHEFDGTITGFELIRRLLETYWESAYPPIEIDDDEPLALRTGVMDWIGEKLPGILKGIPLSSGSRKFSLAHYEMAQRATSEELKSALAAAGRPSAEQFAQAMAACSAPHLSAMAERINRCRDQLTQLEKVADTLFVAHVGGSAGRTPPLLSFNAVRTVLDDCHFQVARALRTKGPVKSVDTSSSTGAATEIVAYSGDEIWQRAMQLVRQGQLYGLRMAQDHIQAAASGRERFLRQLQLSELCIQAGMQAFAYPILDELGKTIDARDLVTWEDADLIRRTWSGLANACKPLARIRPESVARAGDALQRLSALVTDGTPAPTDTQQ
jgi:type VI secretion system ImpA family protein